MKILLTGTPGTGKSTVARLLSGMAGFASISINAVAKKGGLVKKGGEVDLKKLEGALKAEIKRKSKAKNSKLETRNLVVDGHLGCEIKLPLDIAFVLRCEPEKLKARLEKRNYKKKKMDDNLLSEALDYCSVQAEMNYGKGKIFDVDAGKRDAKKTAKLILEIAGGKKKGDFVNWKGWLEKAI